MKKDKGLGFIRKGLENLGSFAFGFGGMAWAALHLSQEALILIGLVGFAIGIFCAGLNWGEYLVLKKQEQKIKKVEDHQWRQTHEK
jgi:hypothetical protein